MIGEAIEWTGMAAYLCILAAIGLGIARWKLHWRRPKPVYHYMLGLLGGVFGTAHVVLIMIFSR